MGSIGSYLWVWLLGAPFVLGMMELMRTRAEVRHPTRRTGAY